jgi:hypothetical protein
MMKDKYGATIPDTYIEDLERINQGLEAELKESIAASKDISQFAAMKVVDNIGLREAGLKIEANAMSQFTELEALREKVYDAYELGQTDGYGDDTLAGIAYKDKDQVLAALEKGNEPT